jgi:hypothetical protein
VAIKTAKTIELAQLGKRQVNNVRYFGLHMDDVRKEQEQPGTSTTNPNPNTP